jgi:hypothetical protein
VHSEVETARLLLRLAAILARLLTPRPTPTAATPCQLVLGFKALHDLVPVVVGDCLIDEHHNPANGSGGGLRETTDSTGDGGYRLSRRGARKIVDGYLRAAALKRSGLSDHAFCYTAATSKDARVVDRAKSNSVLAVPVKV